MDTDISSPPTTRRIRRKTGLFGAFLVAAMAVAAVGAPSGSAKAYHAKYTFDESFMVSDSPCGFEIAGENIGTAIETGGPNHDVFTVIGAITFSANGKSVDGSYAFTSYATPDPSGPGGTVEEDGLQFIVVVPGQGAVPVEAGRYVVHIDNFDDENSPTEVTFGPVGRSADFGPAICAALAPESNRQSERAVDRSRPPLSVPVE